MPTSSSSSSRRPAARRVAPRRTPARPPKPRRAPVRVTPTRPILPRLAPNRPILPRLAPTRRIPAVRPRRGLLGLVAGAVALAAGGVAAGLELEQRIVNRRLHAEEADVEPFFSLRSDGPIVSTEDGVVLHTEIDEVALRARVDEVALRAGVDEVALRAGVDEVAGSRGPDADLTLVFVHGYALSLDCWHFQRRHFRGRFRQVLYDQRGHGRSGRSAPENCRIPVLAADLHQVLTEVVPAGPVVLVGHSMGGMAIMRLAQVAPDLFGTRIRGVALFSTSAGEMADTSPIRGVPGRAFARIAEPLMATLNRVPEVVSHARRAGSDLGFVVTKRMSFGSDVPPAYVEFMSRMLAETPLDVIADFYPAFADLDEYAHFSTLNTVETAVVGGEDDLVTPIAHTDKIVDLLPRAEVRKVPDCGHMGIIEHSELFNGVLDRLVERVRTRLAEEAVQGYPPSDGQSARTPRSARRPGRR